MNNWIAFPKKDLLQEIFLAEFNLDHETLILWNKIKISPEIWSCKDVIEENFWVVAKTNNQIIWYNDIEEGFNVSKYLDEYIILEYCASQQELNLALKELIKLNSKS